MPSWLVVVGPAAQQLRVPWMMQHQLFVSGTQGVIEVVCMRGFHLTNAVSDLTLWSKVQQRKDGGLL